jgi:tetratricopeptide (TPR) repeat protein
MAGPEDELSLELLDEALRRAERAGDSKAVAALQLELGGLYLRSGKGDMARLAFHEAEVAAQDAGDPLAQAEATLQRARVALELLDWPEVIQHLGRLVDSPGFGSLAAERRAAALHDLAFARAWTDAHGPAAGLYRRALELWPPDRDDERLQSLLSLGESLCLHKDWAGAAGVLREARRRLQTGSEPSREAVACELYAHALIETGRAEDAVEPLRRACKLWEAQKEGAALRRAMLDLAELLLQLAEFREGLRIDGADPWEEGLKVLLAWIALAQKDSDRRLLVYGWWRLSQALTLLGHFHEASEALVQAAEAMRAMKEGDEKDLLRMAAELQVRLAQSEPERLYEAMDRAVRLFDRVGDVQGAAWGRRQVFHAASKGKDWERAARALEQMLRAERHDAAQEASLLAHLAFALGNLGRDEAALECVRRALQRLGATVTPLSLALQQLQKALEKDRAGALTSPP